ncbi:hypothetical protein FHG87_012627 [Trinorchestia longiramus]|nr:hypothetical protein FHG87_012627 [Trinorchestia longiramus]
MTAICSTEGLETAPEGFAGLENVVRVHGYPLPVNECIKGGDVWEECNMTVVDAMKDFLVYAWNKRQGG